MSANKEQIDLQLKRYIENIEKLLEERQGVMDEISLIYKEAKSAGFDVKIIRKIIALRKMDLDSRIEMESMVDTYKSALGMISE